MGKGSAPSMLDLPFKAMNKRSRPMATPEQRGKDVKIFQ
jgi:hypothetical protein